MAGIAEQVIDVGERTFSAFGLNEPISRFLSISLISAGALLLIRPMMFFDRSGQPRPWILLTDPEESSVEPTAVPWWLVVVLIGAFSGLLI